MRFPSHPPPRPFPPAPVVVVVGATGLVGEVLLRVLEERDYPVAELRLLAGSRSAGARVRFRGAEHAVARAAPAAFDGRTWSSSPPPASSRASWRPRPFAAARA